MKKTFLLLNTIFLYGFAYSMKSNKTKSPKSFKITIDAKTGSVEPIKENPSKNPPETKLGYEFVHQNPNQDRSLNIALYIKSLKPSTSQDDIQLSQEDI